MPCATKTRLGPMRTKVRLWPKIALMLVVKLVGLTVIWFLFVRGQQVTTDAHKTAQAFGLTGGDPVAPPTVKEDVHGQ